MTRVTVLGGGVAGLVTATVLAERGAAVTVVERSTRVGAGACSWLAGGMLASVSIAISTGQRPLIVLSWSIGIGFSGLSLAAAVADQVMGGARRIGEAVLDGIAGRIAAKRDGK